MEVSGKLVLVTGATGGIGAAIVQALHGKGARLILSGRRTELLEPLAAQVGGRAITCDLADPADVARLGQECADVDVLVANAALPASGRLDSFTVAGLDAALDVNLRAPMVLTHALLQGWTARRAGHAVYVGSISGKLATTHASVYSATKFGLRGFAQGLRDELHGTGVGISVVNPGFVRDAGMFADSGAKPPTGIGTSSPQEVATAVVRAVTDDLGDVDVAPALVRLTAKLNGLAPELVAGLVRRLGSSDTAVSIAAGQKILPRVQRSRPWLSSRGSSRQRRLADRPQQALLTPPPEPDHLARRRALPARRTSGPGQRRPVRRVPANRTARRCWSSGTWSGTTPGQPL